MGVQGLVLVLLAVLEAASADADRASLAVSTSVFFAGYGVVLLVGAVGLLRRSTWARGPMLLTQLIMLGIAWSLRDQTAVAVMMALVAALAIAGVVHPDSIAALSGEDPGESADESSGEDSSEQR